MNSLYGSLIGNKYSLLTIFLITVINYWKIFQTYFQQDEWYGFSQAIYAKQYGIWHLFGVLGSYHLTPLSNIFFSSFFYIFGLNVTGYAATSLLLHCLTSFFIFILSMEIFKKKSISLAAAIIFAVSNTPEQAVTYFGTSLGTIPATLFGVASIYFFLVSNKTKGHVKTFNTTSLLLLFIGLAFKEDIVGLFILYIFFSISKKKMWKLFLIIFSSILYFSTRIVLQIISGQPHAITSNASTYILTIANHAKQFYLKGFAQIFFTQIGMLRLSQWLTNLVYTVTHGTWNPDLVAETVTVPFLEYSIFFVSIALLLLVIWKKILKTKEIVIIFFLLSLITVSIFPFIFLPSSAVMESRHFYFPMVGGSMFVAYIFFQILKYLKKTTYKIIIVVLLCIYIYWNISLTREHLAFLIVIAKPRISFVHQMQNLHTVVPAKVVFYASGDPLPLQSGPGEFLMVIFHDKQNYDSFFKENYFWDHLDSYQEKKNIGFGFFYKKELFLQSYKKYNLRPENVISFNWDDKDALLVDTTESTRGELDENQ